MLDPFRPTEFVFQALKKKSDVIWLTLDMRSYRSFSKKLVTPLLDLIC